MFDGLRQIIGYSEKRADKCLLTDEVLNHVAN